MKKSYVNTSASRNRHELNMMHAELNAVASTPRLDTDAQKQARLNALLTDASARAERESVRIAHYDALVKSHEFKQKEQAYFAVVTAKNGNVYSKRLTACGAGDAYERIDDLLILKCIEAEKVRVYRDICTSDDACAMAALDIARVKAKNAVTYGGTETQYRIEQETRLIAARCIIEPTAAKLFECLHSVSDDTVDFVSVAWDVVAMGAKRGVDAREVYRKAYAALDKLIRSWRSASDSECSMEYISLEDGAVIMLNSVIGSILRGDSKYGYQDVDACALTLDQRMRLRDGIAASYKLMTPTQKDVCRLAGYGLSIAEIARRKDRNVRTIERHMALIREIILDYFVSNVGDLSFLIRDIETREAARRASAQTCIRSEEGKARKRESDKATQAARAKAYRERKKAEKEQKKQK